MHYYIIKVGTTHPSVFKFYKGIFFYKNEFAYLVLFWLVRQCDKHNFKITKFTYYFTQRGRKSEIYIILCKI